MKCLSYSVEIVVDLWAGGERNGNRRTSQELVHMMKFELKGEK